MTTEWYIGFDGQVVGPVDQQQLLDFLKSSEQWRQILVWHSGLDDWKLAKDVQDIAAQVSKGPPPLPAPAAPPKDEAPKEAPKDEAPSIVPAAPVSETKPVEPVAAPVEPAAPPVAPVATVPVATTTSAPTLPPAADRIEVLTAQQAAPPAAAPARRRWGWSATALTVLLLIGGAYLAQQFSRKDSPTVAKATQPSNDAVIERGFAEIVQATALPKRLDDYTTRFDVTPTGRKLVFHHIIDTTRYLVPQNFAAATKEKMLSEACNPSTREALKAGGILEYRFHTQAAFLIGSFEISGNDCGSGQSKG